MINELTKSLKGLILSPAIAELRQFFYFINAKHQTRITRRFYEPKQASHCFLSSSFAYWPELNISCHLYAKVRRCFFGIHRWNANPFLQSAKPLCHRDCRFEILRERGPRKCQ